MAMTPTDFGTATPIDGYGPGFFRIGGVVWQGAVMLCEGRVSPWAGLDDSASLTALAEDADLLLIGMGPEIVHPPAALIETVEGAGLRCETMSSPAAARSYNVLLSEGRRVAVALIPV